MLWKVFQLSSATHVVLTCGRPSNKKKANFMALIETPKMTSASNMIIVIHWTKLVNNLNGKLDSHEAMLPISNRNGHWFKLYGFVKL